MSLRKKFRILLFFLALVGLILSLYLVYEYYQDKPITCPISLVNTCETVKQSENSTLLGVKLPVFGSLYFMILLVKLGIYIFYDQIKNFFFISRIRHSKNQIILSIKQIMQPKFYDLGLFICLLWGISFETYMTYIQIFNIEAICKWCIMIEIIVVLMFFINILELVTWKIKKI